MKKSPLKRKTPLKARSNSLTRRKKLRVEGHSETSEVKSDIQALLREIGLIRDGGCIFRHYPHTGVCGPRRKDGELVLQFDHLNSRVHSISFSDPRLGVIACKRHHFYYKKQYPAEYERCAIEQIGPERAKLLMVVRADKRAHKMDWKLEKVVLERELAALQQEPKRVAAIKKEKQSYQN